MRSVRLVAGPAIAAASLAASVAVSLTAQGGTTTQYFVARLGRDTVALERVTRSPTTIQSDLFLTTPRTRRIHYTATLDANGRVSRFELTGTPAVETPPAPVIALRGEALDTLFTLFRTQGTRSDTARYRVGEGAVPFVNLSMGMLEQMTIQARRSGKDSLPIDIVVTGQKQATPNYVARRGRDSVAIDYFGLPFYLKVDPAGRVLGLNGMRTTQKFLIDRVPSFDIDRASEPFVTRERAGQMAGALSPRDTARAVIGLATVSIDYGRPSKRGRVTFGNIVPWGEVWRTGANAATQFTTSVDLKVGDTAIPAGTYTLWTIPTPTGAQLLFNQQTGQWGTDHDPSKDVIRVNLRQEELAEGVERFTIAVVPLGQAGEIHFDWDRTRWVLPFTLK
jgi:hypothetical protein